MLLNWIPFQRKAVTSQVVPWGKAARPYRTWCRPPEHPLGHYLFSQEANPQSQISKDATEKRVARRVARYRSGMDGYELRDHLSEQIFRAVGGYVSNFSSSVSRISKETHAQQAVYLPHTSRELSSNSWLEKTKMPPLLAESKGPGDL